MILLTGAAGKTGSAVLKALVKRRQEVRVLVRRREQADGLLSCGAVEAVTGDMSSDVDCRRALRGVKSVYHICPNMHPGEETIGRLIVDIARECAVGHFVYHSVLHPQIEEMPHHWLKMRVEELLFQSGLKFTILQPAPYMQNILAGRKVIGEEGYYRTPYSTQARISLVDLDDLAEAAAIVLTQGGHEGAIYEIVGTQAITPDEVAERIGRALGKQVVASEIKLDQWKQEAREAGLEGYALQTIEQMFLYYDCFGLEGNSNVLRWITGREPGTIEAFAMRELLMK